MPTPTLNTRRKALGLSYRNVADATGLSLRAIFRLMANNTLPQSLLPRQALAAALKVDPDGLAALVASKPRGALRPIVRSGSSRRAHARKTTTRGAL